MCLDLMRGFWHSLKDCTSQRYPTTQDLGRMRAYASRLRPLVANFIPTSLEMRAFYRQAMHCLWELHKFIRQFENVFGVQRRETFAALYDFKHTLLKRLIELADKCEAISWQAGLSTRCEDMLSVGLTYSVPGERTMTIRVQWPLQYVARTVQDIMRQRYRAYPPQEPVYLSDSNIEQHSEH